MKVWLPSRRCIYPGIKMKYMYFRRKLAADPPSLLPTCSANMCRAASPAVLLELLRQR